MARKARVQFPGAVYHVLDRGDRREPIFHDDADRERFLAPLSEACARTGWRVHAFVLMGNHYHLLIETPQPNLVAGMRWFQTTWTVRFNRRHGLCGHLFQGRYKAVVVDPEESGYFAALSDYLHLNPVRAGLVRLDQRLFDYRASSYPLYAATAGRPVWFEPRRVLGELGLEDDAAGRRRYAGRMRERAVAERMERESVSPEGAALRAELRRGWCLGGESFRERMLRLLASAKEGLGSAGRWEVDGPVRRSHDEEQARRILRCGCEAFDLGAEELRCAKKSDERKVAIAAAIREATAVPNAWIARELHLGHVSQVSRCRRAALVKPEWSRRLRVQLAKAAIFTD